MIRLESVVDWVQGNGKACRNYLDSNLDDRVEKVEEILMNILNEIETYFLQKEHEKVKAEEEDMTPKELMIVIKKIASNDWCVTDEDLIEELLRIKLLIEDNVNCEKELAARGHISLYGE